MTTATGRSAIEQAGFRVKDVRENSEYRFLSDQAQGASASYGVKSVSLIAERVAMTLPKVAR